MVRRHEKSRKTSPVVNKVIASLVGHFTNKAAIFRKIFFYAVKASGYNVFSSLILKQ